MFRVLLGIGMGGEWASGAALVSETWPDEHRGKALGFMQSGWAIGYAAAALVNALVQPAFGWRAVFFVGIIPAFFTLWVRRNVEEPAIWRTAQKTVRPGVALIFRKPLVGLTVALTVMNTFTLFAWWGFYLWLPSYLTQPPSAGGVGLQLFSSSGFILLMQAGMWLGYVTFGLCQRPDRSQADLRGLSADRVGLLLSDHVSIRDPPALLALGPFVAFFATGYFSGFGAVTAEIYPTSIRASAQGFTYNIGRVASAVAPWAVGSLASTHGFGPALMLSSAAFVLAALSWVWIPETRGKALE